MLYQVIKTNSPCKAWK